MQHHIKDESGDKKYFTQIPNIIVNHSTAYEQSLYLVMKRLAGEGGQCWASLNFLANKMGVHKQTVTSTITKLLKRKWIAETKKTKVPGGYTRTFIIVDLWKMNMDSYEGGVQVTTSKTTGGSQIIGGGAQTTRGGSQTDTNKIYNNIYNKKSSSFKKPTFRGMDMRQKGGKWFCLPQAGGDWLEFTLKEKDIEWK